MIGFLLFSIIGGIASAYCNQQGCDSNVDCYLGVSCKNKTIGYYCDSYHYCAKVGQECGAIWRYCKWGDQCHWKGSDLGCSKKDCGAECNAGETKPSYCMDQYRLCAYPSCTSDCIWGCSYILYCPTGASDSDGGINYSVKGTCTVYLGCYNGACQSLTYTDYCSNSTLLVEYYVSGSVCPSTSYTCPSSGCCVGTCSDGKCGYTYPTQSQSCSYCNGLQYCTGGTQSRTCQSNCTWGSWSSCSGGSCSYVCGYCGYCTYPSCPNYCDDANHRLCVRSSQCCDCSACSWVDCSLANNWDRDSIACNCDCGGYDVNESRANGNCDDGKDNDCDGKIDWEDPGCNQRPTASNLEETQNSCAWGCTPQVAPGLVITLSWNYSDPDNDPQGGYEIFISDGTNSATTTKSSQSQSYTMDLGDFGNWKETQCSHPDFGKGLCWNKTYYWKVRVWDSKGATSDWSATDTFTTPSHPSPYVNFKWVPQKPTVNEVVQFCSISTGTCSSIIKPEDQSKCYDLAGNVVPCSSFNWDFDVYANPSFSTLENPTTTFTSIASSTVTLTITDSSNATCSKSVKIRSTYPLPKWREIGSGSELKKPLANIFESFTISNVYKFFRNLWLAKI